MNILFINNYNCSADTSGGVNRVIYTLTRHFTDNLGYNCFFGYFDDIPKDKRPAEFAGRIKLSPNLDETEFRNFLVDNNVQIVEVNFLRKKNLFTIPAMYKVAKSVGVKLIYGLHKCPGDEAVTYGTFDRVCFSMTHQGNTKLELYRWLIYRTRPLVRPFSDLIIRKKYKTPFENCDKVVLLSKCYLDDFCRIAGVKKSKEVIDKFVAIGNGLPFSQFISEEEILRKQKNVLVVQRLDDYSKRISLILKIWRWIEQDSRLNDWTLTIVGDGESMNYYRHLEEKWKLKRVTFTGLQYPIEYYRNASVFLMTSSMEGWPMVLMETSQMGVPTVAFDSFGALHDIIEDGYNGRIVPNNNMSAFQNALTELMLDDNLRQQMSFNTVVKSREFEMDKIIDKWEHLFEEMIKQ